MDRRTKKLFSSIAVVGLGIMAVGLVAQPASAVPVNDCVTACTATFSSTGAAQSFTIPTGISALSATVAGSAGAPASVAVTHDPTAVGGSGGVASLDLGPTSAGKTFTFGIGATGAGTYLQGSDTTLLAVAGGGGGGGYAAYLQWPDQILGVYPGGEGGAPATTGVTAGTDGGAFGTLAANGAGGTTVGGQAGTGNSTGSTSGSTLTMLAGVPTLGSGGVGGQLLYGPITHAAGNGGGGFTGGGGGAVQRNVPGGDVGVDVIAPGGGGSAFLAAGLTATAQTPNTGSGYVSFTWDYAPTIENTLPGTTPGTTPVVNRGTAVPVRVAGLPAMVPFTVMFDGVAVVSGTTDASGTAIASFTISSTQSAGTYSFQLRVGTETVAVSDPITVTVPTTGGTGTDGPGTDGPGTDGPGTDGPGTDGPGTDGPGTDGPGVTDPATNAPSVSVPRTDTAVATTSLASTGTAFVGGLTVVAILLLVGGVAIFFISRRRRRSADESAAEDSAAETLTDKS